MTTTKTSAKRTEAQLAALARGRATRQANLAKTAKTKAPAKRTASRSPATRQPPSPPAAGAPESLSQPTTSSDLPASSSVDADALSVFFEDAPASEASPPSGGVLSSLFPASGGTSGASSGATSKSNDKKEAEIAAATDAWQEVATNLFIFGAVWMAGKDLQPTSDEANAITKPLVRILMRHYDPARQASNDVLDAVTSIVAMTLYLQRIGPAWQAKRSEQKVKTIRGDRPNTARPVPIEGGRPASVAAAPASAGDARQRADTIRSDPGRLLSRDETNGHTQSDYGLTAEATLEELIGSPL